MYSSLFFDGFQISFMHISVAVLLVGAFL